MSYYLEYPSIILGICVTIHIFAIHNYAYNKNGNHYYFNIHHLYPATLGI